MALPRKSFWSINDISGTWPQRRCHVLYPFIKDYHWSKFQLHSIRVINCFFSNINDYGDSNEKTKCLKHRWEYSTKKFSGCNFSSGNSPGRGEFYWSDFPGSSFPVQSFLYLWGCIKSICRYLVKIISDFWEIFVLNYFYILLNST